MHERLDERVRNLEAHNRRLSRRLAVVTAVAAAAVGGQVLLGLSRPQAPGVVEASEFRLVDKDGKLRGNMVITDKCSALHMIDQTGAIRASLMADKDTGSELTLWDSKQSREVAIRAASDGSRALFWDGAGKRRLAIQAEERGGQVSLFDLNDRPTVTMVTSKEREGFRCMDEHAKETAMLGQANGSPFVFIQNHATGGGAALNMDKGDPHFTLADPRGKNRLLLGLADGDPVVSLFDKAGLSNLELSQDKSGMRLSFFDEQKANRMCLEYGDKVASLCFRAGESKDPEVSLKLQSGMPALRLHSADGKMDWHAPAP